MEFHKKRVCVMRFQIIFMKNKTQSYDTAYYNGSVINYQRLYGKFCGTAFTNFRGGSVEKKVSGQFYNIYMPAYTFMCLFGSYAERIQYSAIPSGNNSGRNMFRNPYYRTVYCS